MSFVVVLLALALLVFVAYRGFSVILFAPICAMLAVLLTDPAHKDSYRDIFAITLLKTAAVGVANGVFYVTGIY